VVGRRSRHLVAAATTLAAAAILFLVGFAVGSAGGAAATEELHVQPLPDWFLPIWDAYGRNPAITPEFDFASLYSAGDAEPAGPRR